MITNERQYKITKTEAERFRAAVDQFDSLELAKQGIDPGIVAAQKASLEQQLAELEEDLARYEGLRSSGGKRLFPSTIAEIGEKLIEARIMQGLSQKALADRLDMKEQQVQRYEQDKYLAANLTRIAEVAEALDLDLHAFFDLRYQKRIDLLAPNLRGLINFDPSKLPIKVMRKLGWLESVRLPPEIDGATEVELAAAFISQSTPSRGINALHLQRVRAGSKQDIYALTAWKAEVLRQARNKARTLATSSQSLDAEFVQRLVHQSRQKDGPKVAIEMLREVGVLVIFVEHLPHTHLDGAAMLLDKSLPVIGITLRFDRLDNFWWVLLHELAHVMLHRDSGLRDGFFDDTDAEAIDDLEREADAFAEAALIPKEIWRNSLVRFAAANDQILQFAKDRGISPAIVAGRIRKERGYKVFADLVGQGEVKRLVKASGYMER